MEFTNEQIAIFLVYVVPVFILVLGSYLGFKDGNKTSNNKDQKYMNLGLL